MLVTNPLCSQIINEGIRLVCVSVLVIGQHQHSTFNKNTDAEFDLV